MRTVIHPCIIGNAASVADHREDWKIIKRNHALYLFLMDKGNHPGSKLQIPGVMLTWFFIPDNLKTLLY
jgi:hypothetical protein